MFAFGNILKGSVLKGTVGDVEFSRGCGQDGLFQNLAARRDYHKIFWVERNPQGPSRWALKWVAHMGIKPTALALLVSHSQPSELISVAHYADFLGDLIFLE